MSNRNLISSGGCEMNNTNERQLFYIHDIEQITGRNRLTLRRWWEKGKFPKPIKLHSSVLVWHITTIQQWLSEIYQNNHHT